MGRQNCAPTPTYLRFNGDHADERETVDEIAQIADNMVEVIQVSQGPGTAVVEVAPLHIACTI
jgi:hypothetical protein